jgi:hypothetical protein
MPVNMCPRRTWIIACICAAAGAPALAQTDNQIPLNYNFHGMAHGPEAVMSATSGNADSILYRSIADRGLVWDNANANAFGSSPLVGATGMVYNLFNTLGYTATTAPNAATNVLDCVHLGDRVYFRGQELFANSTTPTGNAAPWAQVLDLATLAGDGTTATATTATPHGLIVGQPIAIIGANPVGFSGVFTVATAPDATTFTFACTTNGTATGSIFSGSTSNPLITSMSGTGVLATANTVSPHGFVTNDTVRVSGASITGYNGAFTVTTAMPTSFTYSNTTTGSPTGAEIVAATCLHDTTDQVTTLATPITVDGATQIGILYQASNAVNMLAQFDAVMTFHDPAMGGTDTDVTARFSAPDWLGGQTDPAIVSRFVHSQKRMTFTAMSTTHTSFQGVSNIDSASLQAFSSSDASPNLNVIEGIVSVQKIIDAGVSVSGKQLTKIAFRNAFFNPIQISSLSFSGGVGTATLTSNAGFIVGQPIVISGVTPATYNGSYTVASLIGSTQFTFTANGKADGIGVAQLYANAISVSGITLNGSVATATTSADHGLAVGDTVTITGAGIASAINTAAYAGADGTYSVIAVPTSTTFTYACITLGGVSAQMQVTQTGGGTTIGGAPGGRGYAIYAATVRTGSVTAGCCDNATGACTTTFGTCGANSTQSSDPTCGMNACPVIGACCNNATGACTLIYGGTCPSNTTAAMGTTCDMTTCPAIGQCCNNMSGACTLIYGGTCPSSTTVGGMGTSCDSGSNPCPASGACCTGTGHLTCGQSIQSSCTGTYSGDNTTCTPSNPCFPADECASTNLVAMIGSQSGSTLGATPTAALMITGSGSCTQGSFNTGVHNDVFWKFTATASTAYIIDLCGSSFDTVLTVHSGCPVTQGNMLNCNDDSTGQTGACSIGSRSRIASVTLTAGTDYYIGVAGYNGLRGSYTLNIHYASPSSLGSCCAMSGCTLADAAHCTGSFNGTGTTCSPNPCVTAGVCCRGTTCNLTFNSAPACTSSVSGAHAGAMFTAGNLCNEPGDATNPCCYADYNKTGGITIQDIFDYLNDWLAARPFAVFGGDGTTGSPVVQNIFDFLNAWFAGGC